MTTLHCTLQIENTINLFRLEKQNCLFILPFH